MSTNERRCIGCLNLFPRKELIRVLKKFDTNEVVISPSKNEFGRSVYICKNKECLQKALKKGKINKFLKNQVDSGIINLIEKEIN